MLCGNVAGGLGVDTEFFESILVPNVMLHGFLRLQPAVTRTTVLSGEPRDGNVASEVSGSWKRRSCRSAAVEAADS